MTMLGLGGCLNAQTEGGYKNINVADFDKFIKTPGVQIVDVRAPQEFTEGHIAGAVNINLFDSDFARHALRVLDKSRPVAVYCISGKRSATAAKILTDEDYKVVNLAGGILAWESSRYPLTRWLGASTT